jgi:hypothetical protein
MTSGDEQPQSFRVYAREQQSRVDRLLACQGRFPFARDQDGAREAGVEWTADIGDPEFWKNLRIFRRLIGGAIAIGDRATDGAIPPRLDRLRDLVALPSGVPLTLKALLGQRFELDQTLVEIGDEAYLRSRAADLYDEGEGTAITWRGLFTEPPPLLVDGGESQSDPVERTRKMLARLLAVKEATDLPIRARRELKQQALVRVIPVILVATVLFGVAIGIVEGTEDGAFLLAAAAGATGAALGGLIKLRDEVRFGAQIREFVPFFVGQVIVGAAAGLLAFVTVQSGIVDLGEGSSGTAALGFVLGFSEAAFLGLVGRIGETVAGSKETKSPQGTSSDAPS